MTSGVSAYMVTFESYSVQFTLPLINACYCRLAFYNWQSFAFLFNLLLF